MIAVAYEPHIVVTTEIVHEGAHCLLPGRRVDVLAPIFIRPVLLVIDNNVRSRRTPTVGEESTTRDKSCIGDQWACRAQCFQELACEFITCGCGVHMSQDLMQKVGICLITDPPWYSFEREARTNAEVEHRDALALDSARHVIKH